MCNRIFIEIIVAYKKEHALCYPNDTELWKWCLFKFLLTYLGKEFSSVHISHPDPPQLWTNLPWIFWNVSGIWFQIKLSQSQGITTNVTQKKFTKFVSHQRWNPCFFFCCKCLKSHNFTSSYGNFCKLYFVNADRAPRRALCMTRNFVLAGWGKRKLIVLFPEKWRVSFLFRVADIIRFVRHVTLNSCNNNMEKQGKKLFKQNCRRDMGPLNLVLWRLLKWALLKWACSRLVLEPQTPTWEFIDTISNCRFNKGI